MEWKGVQGIDRSLQHRLLKYKNKEELYETFDKNSACFHKNCISKYDKQKLKRKLTASNKIDTNTPEIEKEANDAKLTRRSMQAPTFTSACFFCEGERDLIHCRTLELDRNVRKMAEVLEDSKVLAKLAAGDMCATEAVYHKNCFTDFYNRYRKSQKPSHLDENRNDVETIALASTIQWLKDSVAVSLDEGKVPVYAQRDIVNWYKKKLRDYGASDDLISSVHCTRFTEKILASLPGFIATQSGHSTNSQVVLTLDGDLGQALFQACMHSSTDDILVMADAARRIRQVLFCESQSFNGDTSLECQEASVPNILVRLVSMILEGGKPNRELNEAQRRIASNIAQIIKFNAVKQTRKESTVKFRHSRDNEPPLPVVIADNVLMYNSFV